MGSRRNEKTMQMEGKKLGGRYQMIDRVGGGGMAVVYKAKDLLLNRFVAIKVLNESLSNDAEFIRRFNREAQAAASLSHPNIVNVYDVGQDGYTHYIVMELVAGLTLKQYIQEHGPLPVKEAAEIAMQICDGLAHAHENQIVHRDIKPHNILLGANGRVKVTDFGIARAASSSTITQAGSVMGSVHYFSPEQARGGVIGEKSDIYSLGILLYEMLTGQLPFDGDSAISIALKHLQDPVEDPRKLNPNIPDHIASILLRALEKDPALRYSSAKAMMQDISYAVQMDHRFGSAWGSHPKSRQEYYQATPHALHEETEKKVVATTIEGESPSPLAEATSPAPAALPQRPPEVDTRHTQAEKAQISLGQKTIRHLQRFKKWPNDQDKTVFQRTVIWLDRFQQNLPFWQKILFAIFTIALILSLSLWGIMTVWGWMVKSGRDADANTVVIQTFHNLAEAKQFAAKYGWPNPRIVSEEHAGASEGEVWGQKPAAHTKLDKNEKPQIILYVGEAAGVMMDTDFTGMKQSTAEKKAKEKGYEYELIMCNLSQADQDRYASIIYQEPKQGEKLKKGQKLFLWEHIPHISGCRVPPPAP
jgi:eukaryotic-like serine/threonine-protein kinase